MNAIWTRLILHYVTDQGCSTTGGNTVAPYSYVRTYVHFIMIQWTKMFCYPPNHQVTQDYDDIIPDHWVLTLLQLHCHLYHWLLYQINMLQAQLPCMVRMYVHKLDSKHYSNMLLALLEVPFILIMSFIKVQCVATHLVWYNHVQLLVGVTIFSGSSESHCCYLWTAHIHCYCLH